MMIADSDVLIDFLRGKGAADRIAYEIKTGGLHTTAISAFELWAGAKSDQQAAVVETLLAAMTVLPLERESARRAAKIRRELDGKNSSIGMADSLIAGICLERDGVLITRNKKHFERVPGIKLTHGGEA
ncbi:type II toxin-antitoxin system VapC family toxin [Bdellovibrionota bacterium FG-1]